MVPVALCFLTLPAPPGLNQSNFFPPPHPTTPLLWHFLSLRQETLPLSHPAAPLLPPCELEMLQRSSPTERQGERRDDRAGAAERLCKLYFTPSKWEHDPVPSAAAPLCSPPLQQQSLPVPCSLSWGTPAPASGTARWWDALHICTQNKFRKTCCSPASLCLANLCLEAKEETSRLS